MCVGSALFFAVRYVGIACLCFSFATAAWPRRLFAQYHCANPSESHFHIFALNRDMDALAYRLTPVLQFLVFWLVQVIMQMRIHALYTSRLLRTANGLLFLAEVAAMLLLWHFAPTMLRATREAQYAAVAAGEATPLEAFPEVAVIFWAPGLAFDLWLAGLAAAKLRHRSKVLKRDLLGVLLNDSLMYFLQVAGHMILHVVLTVYVHGSYVTPLFIVGSTVGGSRLLLHLRKAYYGRQDGIEHGASRCEMSFAMPTQDTARRGDGIVDESFFDE